MYRFDILQRVIELAVLGLLQDQDLHGYELRKRLTALVGLRGAISFGSLYPALGRLEAVGAVKAVEANDRERTIPMTGSLTGEANAYLARRRAPVGRAGRARKVYGISEHGRELLVTLLEDPATDDKTFPLKVALCAALSPARRLELFERRRSGLATQLATARAGRRHNPERVDGYLRSLPRARHPDHRTRDRLARRLDRRRARAPPGRRPGHQPGGHNRMTIRLAIAGVGNCSSSLVQGLEYYRDADPSEQVPGLMHVALGGYHVHDIEVVAAFDVDATKVGLDVGKAIFSGQNNTIRFAPVGDLGVTVQRGPTLDGLGKYYRATIEESLAEPVDIAQALRDARADVLVSYLPVGSEQAQKHYAQACIDAGVGFVNAIPVFIASDPEWAAKFEAAGVPIVGDDIKSQVGATIVHRILARLFEDRGMVLDRTYQLNVGGNMDFMNMLERERLESKKISKTQSVTSQIDNGIEADNVHIGPSDHVAWLQDRKWAYIRLEGRNFGDVPLNVELKLEVWDSPNSAGVIIDAVRCAKLAMDRGIGGPLLGPSAYFMKSPPVQYRDEDAHKMVETFAAGE